MRLILSRIPECFHIYNNVVNVESLKSELDQLRCTDFRKK
jgi:hypothetical protein